MSGSGAGTISKGLRCRCPACGEGPLFDGFLHVRRVCTTCGADLSGQDSGDGPVAFIVLIVGGIVVGLALVVEVKFGLPVWLHLLLWLPLTVVLTLALMRPLKALLIALQYTHRREDFSEQR